MLSQNSTKVQFSTNNKIPRNFKVKANKFIKISSRASRFDKTNKIANQEILINRTKHNKLECWHLIKTAYHQKKYHFVSARMAKVHFNINWIWEKEQLKGPPLELLDFSICQMKLYRDQEKGEGKSSVTERDICFFHSSNSSTLAGKQVRVRN